MEGNGKGNGRGNGKTGCGATGAGAIGAVGAAATAGKVTNTSPDAQCFHTTSCTTLTTCTA